MKWLDDLLASVTGESAKPSAAEELERIQREESARPATAEQDAAARRAGYRNHKEYMAWLRQSQNRSGGTTEAPKKPSARAAMSWHPRVLLDYVSDALKGANEKDD
jgi:hypothetical protein